VDAFDVLPDSAGTGTVAGGHIIDCKRGGCGRVPYRRKALGLDVFALGVCEETDLCEAMIDEDAPGDQGSAIVEWSFCAQVLPQENPVHPNYPDITNVQSPAVSIEQITPLAEFDPVTCQWIQAGPSTTDCRTVIEIIFWYSDAFDYPHFTDNGFCDQYPVTYTTARTWTCYYSRRVAIGQFFAEGQYALVKCVYPSGIPTDGSPSTCTLAGGTLCSTDGLTPITPPTLWKPPAYINLVRLG